MAIHIAEVFVQPALDGAAVDVRREAQRRGVRWAAAGAIGVVATRVGSKCCLPLLSVAHRLLRNTCNMHARILPRFNLRLRPIDTVNLRFAGGQLAEIVVFGGVFKRSTKLLRSR